MTPEPDSTPAAAAHPAPPQTPAQAGEGSAAVESPEDAALLEDLRTVLLREAPPAPLAGRQADLPCGSRFGGYTVGRLIGEGGMARVYAARHALTGEPAALKVLKPEYLGSRDMLARFWREARSMARVRHDNVIRILGFPQEGDVQAIALELLTGRSLRHHLDAARPEGRLTPISQAVAWATQAARGLAAAHAVGMVHRDVKPSNLLFDADGTLKVADFGAILLLEGATWLTGVGKQIGTPAYMSPEQCRGDRVTPASDVYSLGATLFEIVTGRLPFDVEEASPLAIMLKHISEPAPDPRTWREDLPRWLATIISRCLSKIPQDRFPECGALADALQAGAGGMPAEAESNSAPPDLIDTETVRRRLAELPHRAIICWACRCARRVQFLNDDPRLQRALATAESAAGEADSGDTPESIGRMMRRIRTLRGESLNAAYAAADGLTCPPAVEAAKAAAAAASCAAARCIEDAAADAAFAARRAVSALHLAGRSVQDFWAASRKDYRRLRAFTAGQTGTVGTPIPADLLDD